MAEQNDSDQEKTEPATPRRLQKAREEGQVARSRELTTFVLLLGGVIGLYSLSSLLYEQLGLVMEGAFLFERQQAFETEPMLANVFELAERTLWSLMPLFALMVVLALTAPALLGGWIVSAKGMKPQLSKLNPAKGLKRIFSSQALAELGKAIAKTTLVGGVLVWFLLSKRGEYLGLMEQPVQQAVTHALQLAAHAAVLMVLTLIVVVLIDVPYQLYAHAKKLKMTKEEVKREHKETEGDPHVKARIRSQQQAISRSRMMSKVPEADVIITNPTHYAVALKYDEGRMGAPRVVAKGTDAIAAKIRELGTEHRVPRLEAPLLARALYFNVDIDREIPAALYTAVAEVLAWAFKLKQVQKEGGDKPPTPKQLVVPEAMAQGKVHHRAQG
ncbi:flagellar type III secretion system protein FlhB [Aliidiomarina halalkaliphila]|uniref:Flagellar biosynthetic protein FlhB n=1 Tax=Aliidiomarina halalkaliphila TaxID=2593535 RepID=A0A552X1S4_9GAMM|nr:flagellar biosynthesis protein FlhB [Aliidiomarina halalkaliphila]TRW48839.1 flagellar type III secretion system protein FlhB [Aliidiomarina halalkaliphila]